MKQNFNGKERDKDDWLALIQSADPRFRLSNVKSPAGSLLSIIECVWEGPQMFELQKGAVQEAPEMP